MKKKRIRFASVALTMIMAMTMILGLCTNVTVNAEVTPNTIVDPETSGDWSTYAKQSTEYVGRIWTDKTVYNDSVTLSPSGTHVDKGDSDFLVNLSALSSTSSQTASTYQPLNIVLVLDQSGSMANRFGDDWNSPTKQSAMKTAVTNFIDQIYDASISSDDVYHKLGIVTYESDSSVLYGDGNWWSGYTLYNIEDENNYQNALNAVNGLSDSPSGATGTDLGMQAANGMLDVEEGRKNIVILFTDGVPTTSSSFSNSVANSAIGSANTMKTDKEATVYSIGIFQDANTNYLGDLEDSWSQIGENNKANRFMNLVSSNSASASNLGLDTITVGSWPFDYSYTGIVNNYNCDTSLGYYKTATNSDELNNIFNEIAEDISEALPPTTVEDGNPQESGYITFTDVLGEYMDVDSVQLVYASQLVTYTASSEADGVVNYDCQDCMITDPSSVYPDANADDVVITVENVAGSTTQKMITVKIPATMIPLRYFDVKEEGNTANVTVNDAYPVRVYYGVSVNDNAKNSLASGKLDADLSAYVKNNTEDGKVVFYSNNYAKGSANGLTTATFNPAKTNPFYYYTENTNVYSAQNTQSLITNKNNIQVGDKIYYQTSYYEVGSNVQKKTVWHEITVTEEIRNALAQGGSGNNQYVYFPSGTQKFDATYLSGFNTAKAENLTETATNAVAPSWNETDVEVALGNNGKITLPVAGTLKVTKNVEGDSLPSGYENTEFEFTFELANDNNRYSYEIDNGSASTVADETIASGETFTLKDGQSIVITGLPEGAEYTITENTPPNGYTPSYSESNTGTIVSGEESSVVVTNTYSVSPVELDGSASLKLRKDFSGRDTDGTEQFTFMMVQDVNDAIKVNLDGNTEVSVTMDQATYQTAAISKEGNFGNITFEKPGTYNFYVWEDTPTDDPILGVNYTSVYYKVTVVVSDNGGQLVTNVTYTKVVDENEVPYTYSEDNPLVFENTFSADETSIYLYGTKTLTNGQNNLKAGMFKFDLKVQELVGSDWVDTQDAPLPANTTVYNANYEGSANSIYFGQLVFDATDVGHTYRYIITEDSFYNHKDYFVYDDAKKIVQVEVVTEMQDGNPVVKAIPTDGNGNDLPLSGQLAYFNFTNTYEIDDVTLTGDAGIKVNKTISGREWQDVDQFTFELTAIDNAPLPNGATGSSTVTVSKADLQNGVATKVFDNITYTKAGDYKYTLKETGTYSGFETNSKTVNVVVSVKDNQEGQLVASITYDGNATPATFNNSYSAQGKVTVNVEKTFNAWINDTFTFNLKLAEDSPTKDGYTIASSEARVTANQKTASFGDITFTKAGEYKFVVSEVQGSRPGVTYAQEQTIELTVEDNFDGTLSIKRDGTEVSSVDLNFVNTYEPNDVTLSGDSLIRVRKYLSGRDFKQDDEFTFTLTAQNGAPEPTEKTLTLTYDDLSNGRLEGVFGEITYDAVGDYVYEITENVGAIEGVTYTDAKYRVTVRVSDPGLDGQLDAQVLYTQVAADGSETTEQAANFRNRYNASGEFTLGVHKVVDGREEWIAEDQYNFTLALQEGSKDTFSFEGGVDSSTVTINKDSQDHSATFDKITFYEEGEYVFTVTEEDNDIDGVTYDGPKTITFEAVDENKDGNLTVSVRGDNVAEGVVTFTNEYNLNSATLGIDLTKTITGKAWQANDSFDFTLEAKDEVTKAAIEAGSIVMPKNTTVTISSNTADHKALFDRITFKKEGTYTFTVSEGDTGIENWQDVASQDIVVTVTDDDHGQLVVENLTPANTVNASTSLTFENVWTPTPVSVAIQGIKQMSGRDLLDTDVFEFVITANKENSPMPAQPSVNNEDEIINFGSLTFNQTGTYEYTITETIPETIKGVEHDGASQVTVTVNITDEDNDGVFESSLTYSQSVENDTSKFLFKNKYEADPVTIGETVTTGVVANKVVENVDPDNQYTLDANDFSFTLVKGNNKDSDPIKEAETVLTNGQDGSFVVIPADTEYTEVGTYVYTLKENATSIPGITVDSKVYTITVDITDEGFDGKLDAKVTITVGDTPADAIVFTNKFDALSVSPTEELVGTKVLNGKPLANNEFEFEFKAADPAYATTITGADAEGKVVVTNYSGIVDKNIKFPSLTFDKEGVYSYTISEVSAGKYGFTYDASVYTVTYTVELNENNALEVVSTTITKGDTSADAIVFTNSYDPDPAIVSEGTGNAISVNKTLTGRELKADEFTFDLYWVEGDKEVLIDTATNDADGNVVFGPVEHVSTGVWNYVVKERGAGNTVDGVTYDTSVVDVAVKVTDEGYDGKLDATVEYSQDRTFENSYEAKDVTDVILPVKKELANRELRDGEFSFELYQDGKLIDTTTNDVNGDVRFKGLTFTEADQTVTYTVKEVKGTDKTVTYDDTVYEIKVSVTDNLKGQLEAKVEVVNDEDGDNVATFSNTYAEPEILVPDTSDNNITLLVSIAAACATGLMITLVLKRKIRHN